MSDPIHFGPFRLDLRQGRLWRGEAAIPIRAKTFAVLQYLAERPGELVTKQELLDAVWHDVAVTEDMPRICVRELRRALGESARTARFIETERGRGYRFVIPAAGTEDEGFEPEATDRSVEMVGRASELARLRSHHERASAGQRANVWITGEGGIGKTTLLDSFLADLPNDASLLLGHGQCIEGRGEGEPYQPVLEAVAQWCRGARRDAVVEVLGTLAPTWLAELPWLAGDGAADGPADGLSRSGDRMLREFCVLIEALGREATVVLALEDLHWSDTPTIHLLSALAQRREPARLLVVATLRPADADATGHPAARLLAELERKRLCEEIAVASFDEPLVARLLARSFDDDDVAYRLAPVVTAQTGGNPFFVRAVSDHLVEEGVIERGDRSGSLAVEPDAIELRIPDGIRRMVEAELGRLDATTLEILEAASLVDGEFSSQQIEAALRADIEEIEATCDDLAHAGQLLSNTGEVAWPDGSAGASYAFRHTFYPSVLRERVGATRRRRLHERLGKRLEVGFAEAGDQVAAQLALHFEACGAVIQAVHWLERSAALATRRYASPEAEQLLSRAIGLLHRLPESEERSALELRLQLLLGPVVATQRGLADESVLGVFTRAVELCDDGDPAGLDAALVGLQVSSLMRGELASAVERGRAWLARAERGDPNGLVQARLTLGLILYFLGELTEARDLLERGAAAYSPERDRSKVTVYDVDLGVTAICYLAFTLWALGEPALAAERMAEAETLARELRHPNTIGLALTSAAWLLHHCRETDAALASSEAAVAFSTEHGPTYWLESARITHSWALIDAGRPEEGRNLILEVAASAETIRTHVADRYAAARLAEAMLALGDPHGALALLDPLLDPSRAPEERIYQSALHRLRGKVLLALDGREGEAERELGRAVETAAAQGARGFQLQAALDLARLQGSAEGLRSVVEAFDPALETVDLREARRLLRALEGA